jgi:DNA invertase Pin-like site-specific DNA recombinase
MKRKRAALYIRVSTDGQTVENQRLALEAVAQRRGWTVVEVYQDNGISGAKGRDKRPAFDAALKDAVRRKFDVLMVWSIDRMGRSTATVTAALAELEAAGVAIYADKEAMDATTPHGKAMLHMAAVFAELERGMIRDRVMAGLERARAQGVTLGRPRGGPEGGERHPHPPGPRRRHPEGRQAPGRRCQHRAAGQAGASGSSV